jgi:N6-L-threonylcarbamoyladenine synthase
VTLSLGIETSCDETSAAIVEDGRLVRSNVVSSQVPLHAEFGGVVPEIASRQHVRAIVPVVQRALDEAGAEKHDLDSVAATQGPGLAGALLVGLTFGRAFALALDRPFIPVNHLEGHLHSVWLARTLPLPAAPELPLLALIVSGGHTELVLVRNHDDYQVLGRTLDDAAGEAFDKVAKLLGLPYPGGPAIETIAQEAKEPVAFPRSWLPGTSNFSFSGLKTAVLHHVHQSLGADGSASPRGASLHFVSLTSDLPREQVANIAAGFQESVVEVLVKKTWGAASDEGAKSVAVVGGVAASRALRRAMDAAATLPLYVPDPEYCTDNGAMIASAGFFTQHRVRMPDVQPSMSLASPR